MNKKEGELEKEVGKTTIRKEDELEKYNGKPDWMNGLKRRLHLEYHPLMKKILYRVF